MVPSHSSRGGLDDGKHHVPVGTTNFGAKAIRDTNGTIDVFFENREERRAQTA